MNEKNMYAGFSIFPDERLILELISGSVTLDGLDVYNHELYTNKDYSSNYDIIISIDNLYYDFTINDFKEYLNKFSKQKEQQSGRRVALIAKKMHQIVYVNQYIKEVNSFVDVKIFFHIEEAIVWLNREAMIDVIKEKVEEISNKPEFIYADCILSY